MDEEQSLSKLRIIKSFPSFFHLLDCICEMQEANYQHMTIMSTLFKKVRKKSLQKLNERQLFYTVKFLEDCGYIYFEEGRKQTTKVYRPTTKGKTIVGHMKYIYNDAINYSQGVDIE